MKSLIALSCALFVSTAVGYAQDWAKARVESSPRHLEWVTVKSGSREVGCYVGYPEIKDKAPVVLVIHEIYGLSDWARSMVDQLAEAGYIAIAPDLLWGLGAKGGGTVELSKEEIGLKIRALDAEQITADLRATLTYGLALPACNGKSAVAGFCWGGSQSFRFASNEERIGAALVFYGSAQTQTPEFLGKIKAPVYGFYAGNDARINATLPATTEAMKSAGKLYEPVFYEGAGHGFMRAGEDPKGSEANQKARTDAWLRVKAILGKL